MFVHNGVLKEKRKTITTILKIQLGN